jgi:hypothetical protein
MEPLDSEGELRSGRDCSRRINRSEAQRDGFYLLS